MIILENRLTEVFDQLPLIDGFKPVFDWGDKFNLMNTLKRYSENNKSPYPLIYQISSKSDQSDRANQCSTRLILYLACQNTDTTLSNKERWAMSYANVLFPLCENIVKSFWRSGIVVWNGDYSIEEEPNFGKETANFTIDIWDVLVFEAEITVTNNCIKQNIFNL